MARLEFMEEDELKLYLDKYDFELVEYPEPEKVIVKCKKRGHIKEHYIYYIKNAKCSECSKQDRKDYVKEYIESKGYRLLNEYNGDKSKLKMICDNGHTRECSFNSFKKYNCTDCTNSMKLSELISKVSELGYEFIKYPENARDVATAYCPKGHIREAKIHNFLNHSCGECVGKSFPKNIGICNDVFSSRGFILLETEYINCKTKMKYKCVCGDIRYTTLDNIMNSDIKTCNNCKGNNISGENHPNWKGGISSNYLNGRNTKEYNYWRKSVYKRDNYTCQCCNKYGGILNAHHIENYSEHEEIRLDIINGITLCKTCHDMTVKGSFHHTYGTRDNDIHQLQDYFDEIRETLNLPPIDIIEDIIYKDYIFDN